MVRIGLFCAAGFSTGMLLNNMKAAAAKRGIEVSIDAYGQTSMDSHIDNLDVALLGPQVAYAFDKSEAICKAHNVPISLIPMADYGMLDGDKVLDLALSLVGN